MRTTVLAIAVAFTALLGFLTLYVILENGLTIIGVTSIVVLALFVFGILGALSTPPDR